MWGVAYVVELVQHVTRGRFPRGELGKLTPATLTVSSMNYAFDIGKARELLGYEVLWSVDQGIQRVLLEDDEARGAGKSE